VPILTLDVGGTRMRAAIVGEDGQILERKVAPTPRDAPYPDVLLALAGSLLERGEIHRAVVGVAGRVEYASGLLEYAPNLPEGWPAKISQDRLARALGLPVALANDADLAAVGEWRFGAGRGYDDLVYVTISTGIGAGVILGGRLMHGRRSLGEVGHTIIDRHAAFLAEPSTLEDQGSGTALARLAQAAGLDADGAEVVRLLQAGKAAARRVWESVVEAAGIGAANLASVLPAGDRGRGGVSRAGELLLGPMRVLLRRLGPAGLAESIEVAGAALGDDAGLVGGAGWEHAFVGVGNSG
jgi:glucokinase